MKLKIKKLKFLAGRTVCMMHEDTAKKLSLHVGNRVLIEKGKKKIISIVDIVDGIVFKNQTAVSDSIIRKLHLDLVKMLKVF